MSQLEIPADVAKSRKEAEARAFGNRDKWKKAKQSPTNALTDAVIKYIQLRGGQARRINTTGTYDEKLKRYRRSGTKKGTGDISACWRGLNIWVEVKYGKDKLSDAQIKFGKEVEESGGFYFVAKSIEQFKMEFERYVVKPFEEFEKQITFLADASGDEARANTLKNCFKSLTGREIK